MAKAINPFLATGNFYGLCDRWPVRAEIVDANGISPHYHNFLEFNLVVSGSAMSESATGAMPVQPGDIFFVTHGAWHAYHLCKSLRLCNCILLPGLLENELAWLKYEPALGHALFSAPLTEQCRGIWHARVPREVIDQCWRQLSALPNLLREKPTKPDAGTRSGAIARFLSFLSILEEHFDAIGESIPYRQAHPLMREVVLLLNSDLARPWRLGELAERLLVDRAYLNRLCRKHIGLPPIALLARLRADRAAYLLARTAMPISAVGAIVGWPVPDHFAKRFRHHYHQSATQYRQASEKKLQQ